MAQIMEYFYGPEKADLRQPTRYPQVIASVMGFAFISFLVTLNYYGKLKPMPLS